MIKERLFGMWAKFIGLFKVVKGSVKVVDTNEGLLDVISRIRVIKDKVMDLIRIEDMASTTKYDILEYQKEIDEFRIAALDSLGIGNYTGRTQFLLINKILVDSSEVIELITRVVLMSETDKDIKRPCLVYSGEVV